MYTDKTNVLQLLSLMRAHGVRRVVVAPGSRNIPLAQGFTACPDFECFRVTDERSAGFFALGLALEGGEPAAVCCTSGSALLNIHPAVAEAYYQQVPLLVISADRPAAWIGQMDGQTLPQPGVFGPLVRRAVALPEVRTDEDAWHSNRLINEALLALRGPAPGPVHINIPIGEPFFAFPTEALPQERVIRSYGPDDEADVCRLMRDTLAACPRRMLIPGQTGPHDDPLPADAFPAEAVCLCEDLHNGPVRSRALRRFDLVLASAAPPRLEELAPGLVITWGGHVVSKRLKQWLRRVPSLTHWHVSEAGEPVDVFGRLTAVFRMSPAAFLARLRACRPPAGAETEAFVGLWHTCEAACPAPAFGYSAMGAVNALTRAIAGTAPVRAVLHLANSSAVRYAQLAPVCDGITVCCNRGVNGIEGSLSAAVGYASVSDRVNYVVIGDLSFFYDMNALWNGHIRTNLRVMLLNNGGGEIFRSLPGLRLAEAAADTVAGTHRTSARGWATERGFRYLPVTTGPGLEEALRLFVSPVADRPMLMEVFTDRDTDIRLLKDYYRSLRD